jgi:hypothetical protein
MTAAPSITPPHGRVPAAGATTILADAAGIDLTRLPGRDLEPHELRALVSAIALDPAGWSEHVAFADGQRHYVNLYRDNYVDVWLLCWTPDNDTGWHDHDLSSGAVAVVRGELVEHNLALGQDSVETVVPAGRVFDFGPDHIHRLTGRADASVSVHAYSPPLWRMGQYVIGSDGVLRRLSVSYADELRPLDTLT